MSRSPVAQSGSSESDSEDFEFSEHSQDVENREQQEGSEQEEVIAISKFEGTLHQLIASDFEEEDVVDYICDHRKDFDLAARDEHGRTLLLEAVRLGKVGIVKGLIDFGIGNCRDVDNEGNGCLHIACTVQNCDGEDFEELTNMLLVGGAKLDVKNNAQDKPIHLAALHFNSKMAEILISFGANIYEKNAAGLSALDISKSASDAALRALNSGAQISAGQRHEGLKKQLIYSELELRRLHHGKLLKAMQSTDYQVMTEFALEGLMINEKLDVSGNTPLYFAVQSKDWGCVLFLLDNGANLYAKNALGQTAYEVASEKFRPMLDDEKSLHEEFVQAVEAGNLKTVKQLFNNGITKDTVLDEERNTAMHLVAKRKNVRMANLLFFLGAKIDERFDSNFQTPEMIVDSFDDKGPISQAFEAELEKMANDTDENGVPINRKGDFYNIARGIRLGDMVYINEVIDKKMYNTALDEDDNEVFHIVAQSNPIVARDRWLDCGNPVSVAQKILDKVPLLAINFQKKNAHGLTPLDMAGGNGFVDLVNLMNKAIMRRDPKYQEDLRIKRAKKDGAKNGEAKRGNKVRKRVKTEEEVEVKDPDSIVKGPKIETDKNEQFKFFSPENGRS